MSKAAVGVSGGISCRWWLKRFDTLFVHLATVRASLTLFLRPTFQKLRPIHGHKKAGLTEV